MSWSHTNVWQLKIGRNISFAGVPPEELRVPGPHQASQSSVSVPEGEVTMKKLRKKLKKLPGMWNEKTQMFKQMAWMAEQL